MLPSVAVRLTKFTIVWSHKSILLGFKLCASTSQRPMRNYWQLRACFRCDDQREKHLLMWKTTMAALHEVSIDAATSVMSDLESIFDWTKSRYDSEGFSGWKGCFHSLFDWQKIDFPTGSTGGRALLLFSHLSRIFWSRCLSISKNVLLVSFKEAHQYHFLCVHKCFHHFFIVLTFLIRTWRSFYESC